MLQHAEQKFKKVLVAHDMTVVNIWNSLPKHVVLAESTNSFKSWLDKHWRNQDIIYNFKSETMGTRSEINSTL